MHCCHSKWLQLSVSGRWQVSHCFTRSQTMPVREWVQAPQANIMSASFVLQDAGAPLAACLAPLLTGEVKEIKWNILNLILPNVLWHPHSAETEGVPTQRNSDKTNSASLKRILCHKTCVHHLHWCSLTWGDFYNANFYKLWSMFWGTVWDSTWLKCCIQTINL